MPPKPEKLPEFDESATLDNGEQATPQADPLDALTAEQQRAIEATLDRYKAATEGDVTLDLDVLFGERTVRLGGRVFGIPAELPVETMARCYMLFTARAEATDKTEQMKAATELVDIITDNMVPADDGERPKLGPGAMEYVLALMTGEAAVSPQEALLNVLRSSAGDSAGDGDDEDPTPEPVKPNRAARRSRSTKRSPARS